MDQLTRLHTYSQSRTLLHVSSLWIMCRSVLAHNCLSFFGKRCCIQSVCGIYPTWTGCYPSRSGADFEMCWQSLGGLSETGLWTDPLFSKPFHLHLRQKWFLKDIPLWGHCRVLGGMDLVPHCKVEQNVFEGTLPKVSQIIISLPCFCLTIITVCLGCHGRVHLA